MPDSTKPLAPVNSGSGSDTGGAATSDIGLIAQAVNGLSQLGMVISKSFTAERDNYLDMLYKQGVPIPKDWLAQYRTDYTGQNQNITFALIIAIIIAILAVMFSPSKPTN